MRGGRVEVGQERAAVPMEREWANLPLREYRPRPTLRVSVHEVPRARVPVVDVHNHLGRRSDLFRHTGDGDHWDVGKVVTLMDECNVRTVVNAFPPTKAAYSTYFRFFETDDEHFPYSQADAPRTGRWAISGVHLPEAVLTDVYRANAQRVIPALSGL